MMELCDVIRTLALLMTSSLLVVSAAASNKGFIEKGSKLYKVLNHRAGSHDTAAHLCAQHNAMLPEPKTEIENQHLATLGSEMFYIGMSDSAEEGKWVWDSDGSDVTWFEWIEWTEPGWGGANPNGGTRENCAVMLKDHGKGGKGHRHEGWADKPCDNFPVHVVCEKKATATTTPFDEGPGLRTTTPPSTTTEATSTTITTTAVPESTTTAVPESTLTSTEKPIQIDWTIGCTHKGKKYHDGESFKDDCNTCTCRRGNVVCTRMGCIPAKCPRGYDYVPPLKRCMERVNPAAPGKCPAGYEYVTPLKRCRVKDPHARCTVGSEYVPSLKRCMVKDDGFTLKGSKLYKVLNDRAQNYAEAAALCAQHQAILPEPKTEAENSILASLGSGVFYLGMSDKEEEGRWVWGSDGSGVTWFSWVEWEEKGWTTPPNGGTRENCAIMFKEHREQYKGHRPEAWADKPCDQWETVDVVCQKDATPAPTQFDQNNVTEEFTDPDNSEPPLRCPTLNCFAPCPYGFRQDKNGCDTCDCVPMPRPKPTTSPARCPAGYEKVGNKCRKKIACRNGFTLSGNRCYKYMKQPTTWRSAQAACGRIGAYLAEPISAEEDANIKGLIKSGGWRTVWIGATDQRHEGTWVWRSTGQRLKFSDWIPGNPSNHGGVEDCAAMLVKGTNGLQYNMQWNDYPCGLKLNFVCQQKTNK